MADFQVTWKLSYQQYGARESMYWSDPGGDLPQLLPQLARICTLRRSFLASNAQVDQVSIKQLPSFQQVNVLYGPPYTGPGVGTSRLDDWTTALLVRMFDGTRRWRRGYWCHFLPSGAIVYAKPPAIDSLVLTAGYRKIVQDWVAAMNMFVAGGPTPSNGNWAIAGRNAASGIPVLRVPISLIEVSTDGFFEIVVPKTTLWQPGEKVHVHGALGCTLAGINGDHVILTRTDAPPPGNTTVLKLDKRQCCKGPIPAAFGPAKAYLVERDFALLKYGVIEYLTHRKMGKPEEPRGRARKRACRCP